MPKTTNVFDLKISKTPTITVIEQNKNAVKYLYITAGPGERYRVSSGYTSSKEAKRYADQLTIDLAPATRAERAKIKTTTRVTIEEAFDLYIKAKESAQDPDKLREYGPNPAIIKFVTLRNEITNFLSEWNERPREKKKIAPAKTVDRLQHFDEITTYWLETAWRPTWFDGKGSFWSKSKRRDLVIEMGHWAQRNGYFPDTRSRLGNRCECVFCNMAQLKKNTENVQPTPPFEPRQYAMIIDSCALFEASFRDNNISQLRVSNERLRAFIEVMRWCGPRISDASLMCKDDLRYDKAQRRYIWTYFPIKNKKKKQVMVPVPDHVVEQLQALPNESGFDPRYYFWSGNSTKRNAPDPWHRALLRLWELCPAAAKEVYDKRNKKKMRPTSHMFRNTFCVQCRMGDKANGLHGMSYSEIADAIGDTEEVVRDHYSAYCEDYDRMVLDKVSQMQQAGAKFAGLVQ